MKNACHPNIRRGYTLLELLAASIAASFLVIGLTSSIYIAARGTDPAGSPVDASIQGNEALTELTTDIQSALSFSEVSPTALTFTVPDRNNDTSPETIRYAWSGTPGDPLTRQYNLGAVVTVVDNVHVFQHGIPSPKPNLLTNADMETGTTGWQAIPNATMYDDWTTVHSGNVSLYAYRNNASYESGIRQDVTSQLVNGTQYEVGAWMRKWAAAQPYGVTIQLRLSSSGSGEQVFAISPTAINNSSFQLVKGKVTPTWSGTLTSAYWEATGVSNIQEIYVDDAFLRLTQSQQHVTISLQVGADSRSRLYSGVGLLNAPL